MLLLAEQGPWPGTASCCRTANGLSVCVDGNPARWSADFLPG
ncbi:hypothetical protein [Streptacidiphilus albus]|nr:hypothetical protein [Streptacidiphilus albus]